MLTALLLTLTALPPGADVADDRWSNQVREFGPIEAGEPLRVDFTLSNRGTEAVGLLDYKVSCGCLSVVEMPASVPPGTTARVVCKLNTAGLRGRVSQSVTVRLKHPAQDAVKLDLRGVVRAVWVEPESVDFGVIGSGSRPTREAIIVAAGYPEARVEGIELADAARLGVTMLPGSLREDQQRLDLNILGRLKLDWKGIDPEPGAYASVVNLRTNVPGREGLKVPVTAHVAGVSGLTPSRLLFGQVRGGQPTVRDVTLRLDSIAEDIDVEALEFRSDHPFVIADAYPPDARLGTLRIRVKASRPDSAAADPDARRGLIRGQVGAWHRGRLVFSIPYVLFLGAES